MSKVAPSFFSLLFVFGSLVLVFQYTGIRFDDVSSSSSTSTTTTKRESLPPEHARSNESLSSSSSSETGTAAAATAAPMISNVNRSSCSNSTVIPVHQPEIPPEYSARKIYSFKEIVNKFVQGHRIARSKVPEWSTKADHQLLQAKTSIQNLNQPKHSDTVGLYPPLYHNFTNFRNSYELMEKTLKVYIYREGSRPIFHESDGILTGTYAVEGWFMKLLKSNKHNFVTKNPDEAHLFYIPFSSVHLRLQIPTSPLMRSYVDYLKNYLDLISAIYPYWNRTGGADHFFTACHDWSEYITRDIMSSCIRAICDADMYNKFTFGKDVSLPTTRIFGTQNHPQLNMGHGNPPSKRKTLAFFAGQSHGYVRPILFHHWENTTDSSIKVFGGSTSLQTTEAYTSYMRGSKYCICPRGYAAFGPRFMEAIYFECVPVLVSDNYVPPFSDVLDWEKFSVFVTEKEIPRLKQVLIGIPEWKYRRLYRAVRRVKRHFVWHHPVPKKYDAFHMILYSLWVNRVLQFQPSMQ